MKFAFVLSIILSVFCKHDIIPDYAPLRRWSTNLEALLLAKISGHLSHAPAHAKRNFPYRWKLAFLRSWSHAALSEFWCVGGLYLVHLKQTNMQGRKLQNLNLGNVLCCACLLPITSSQTKPACYYSKAPQREIGFFRFCHLSERQDMQSEVDPC
jgi:hypothetical protein